MVAAFRKGLCLNALVLLLVACSSSTSDSRVSEDAVSQLLSERLSASLVELKTAIEQCEKAEEERGALTLSESTLEEFSREQLLIGLGHLHFHNRFECEKQSRQAVAFDLGVMRERGAENVSAGHLESINRSLIYPSEPQLEYEAKYQDLPDELISALESSVGSQPFNLMESLRINDLSR